MAAEWIDYKQASGAVGKTVRQIQRWVNGDNYPKIRTKKVGRKLFILKSDLLKAYKKIKTIPPQNRSKDPKKKEPKQKLSKYELNKQQKIEEIEKTEFSTPEFEEIGGFENLYDDEFWKDKPLNLLKLREEILKIRTMRIGKENQNKAARKGFVSIRDAMKIQTRILHEINKMELSFLNSWGPVIIEIMKLKKATDTKRDLLTIATNFIKSWANGWRGNMARVSRELIQQIENQGCIVDVSSGFEVIETE